jgi:biopolymer transport protein ExbD
MSTRRSRKHNRRREAEELNITAFMNLMVVLTPFLLITAVFSRLGILELNLPAAQSEAAEPKQPEFQLEITVRESGIEIGDRTAGVLSRIEKTGDNYQLNDLSTYLARIKQQFPSKVDATLLLEPNIPYQLLVTVMDRIRVSESVDAKTNQVVKSELFPEIAIGDAPVPN